MAAFPGRSLGVATFVAATLSFGSLWGASGFFIATGLMREEADERGGCLRAEPAFGWVIGIVAAIGLVALLLLGLFGTLSYIRGRGYGMPLRCAGALAATVLVLVVLSAVAPDRRSDAPCAPRSASLTHQPPAGFGTSITRRSWVPTPIVRSPSRTSTSNRSLRPSTISVSVA